MHRQTPHRKPAAKFKSQTAQTPVDLFAFCDFEISGDSKLSCVNVNSLHSDVISPVDENSLQYVITGTLGGFQMRNRTIWSFFSSILSFTRSMLLFYHEVITLLSYMPKVSLNIMEFNQLWTASTAPRQWCCDGSGCCGASHPLTCSSAGQVQR